MEIKNISGIVNSYNKIKMSGSKIKASPTAKKTDKIEFNFARSVEAAKANLAAAVNEDMQADRINEISEAVNNGEYNVSPEAVAQAILTF